MMFDGIVYHLGIGNKFQEIPDYVCIPCARQKVSSQMSHPTHGIFK